ncbi:hypothetical protein KC329_g58 [Hortaea werneckii]|nr:hypothetical protein KC329_g58 [Hortaea werneckii]
MLLTFPKNHCIAPSKSSSGLLVAPLRGMSIFLKLAISLTQVLEVRVFDRSGLRSRYYWSESLVRRPSSSVRSCTCFFEQFDLCFTDAGYVGGDFQGTRDRDPVVRLFFLECRVQKLCRSVEKILSASGSSWPLFRSEDEGDFCLCSFFQSQRDHRASQIYSATFNHESTLAG